MDRQLSRNRWRHGLVTAFIMGRTFYLKQRQQDAQLAQQQRQQQAEQKAIPQQKATDQKNLT